MAEGCCSNIAKMMLFIVNFCVWIVGVALIGVGTLVLLDSEQYSSLFGNEDTLTIVAGVVIGLGCLIFVIGFSACYGAIKENTCMLKVYFSLVLIVAIIEVTVGILTFLYQDDLKAGLEKSIGKVITEDYNEGSDTAATLSVDAMQIDFKCCGGSNITDWQSSEWADNSINIDKAAPISCCKNLTDACNAGTGSPGNINPGNNMNTKGCGDAFAAWLQDNYIIVGAVCLGLLVFEILAMISSCCLISGINKNKVHAV